MTPPLLVVYATNRGVPVWNVVEDTAMTRPQPFSIIPGTNALDRWKSESTLTARIRRQSSHSSSANGITG